ncbi:MAG: YSC84-related protein [Paracoccaceae bacterium]
MTHISRRLMIAGAVGAAFAVAGCDNGLNGNGAEKLDARADSALNFLSINHPETQDLIDNAAGYLMMPLVTEAGFGFGASYGRGVLRVGNATVDYYQAAQASVGFQIGAQQYAHALFFMTEDALATFRNSPGWAAGADLEYALNSEGQNLSATTTTALSPVVAVVFGQAGLIAGATIEGTKYSRIIP